MATTAETLALAFQYHQAGQLTAAEWICRQIVAADPKEANAWNLLGVINAQLGQYEASKDCFQRAVEIHPDWADALYNLAKAQTEQGNFDEAAASYRRAIALNPNYAEAHNNLGVVLAALGKLDEAVACHGHALRLKPDFAVAHNNLGVALRAQGKLAEAVACCRQALQLQPDFAEAHNNLGLALQGQRKLAEAVACYRQALHFKPDLLDAINNLGDVRTLQGNYADAIACYRHALEVQPDAARTHCSLGSALHHLGELDEALACYRRALELKPHDAATHSTLLCALQYRSSVTLQELAEAHAEYEQRHAAVLRAAWSPHDNIRDPRRCLRLGFLSCDLCQHPVGYFLIRVLENLDREQCETICYHGEAPQDDLTTRFEAASAVWWNASGRTDGELAERIREDRIDILFDLAGHTAGNRLLLFARKPAPIQVTWIGYAGTTGLAAMDYLLADRYEVPPESERYYRERVLRMPDGYLCYDPPPYAPPVSPLPALEKGYVTFAAFHNPAKITPQMVEVWARVLQRLPQARLVLQYRGMDDPAVASRLTGLFAGRGIDPGRLELLRAPSNAEYMAQYQRIDIALDSFPYNGCTTTCEALWMGVPVVTCPGETYAGRASLSHLSNVGLTETIAGDLDEYVEVAASLAGDLPRLAAIRAGLRERMAASPLCDGKRFAANFLEVLRGGQWRDWCENGG